jgi:hypothetical protein
MFTAFDGFLFAIGIFLAFFSVIVGLACATTPNTINVAHIGQLIVIVAIYLVAALVRMGSKI